MSTTSTDDIKTNAEPKVAPSAAPTRRYPEFIATDAVLNFLRELHNNLDGVVFNLRSTITQIITGAAETNTPAPPTPAPQTEEEAVEAFTTATTKEQQ